jgi:hypothetical protein
MFQRGAEPSHDAAVGSPPPFIQRELGNASSFAKASDGQVELFDEFGLDSRVVVDEENPLAPLCERFADGDVIPARKSAVRVAVDDVEIERSGGRVFAQQRAIIGPAVVVDNDNVETFLRLVLQRTQQLHGRPCVIIIDGY